MTAVEQGEQLRKKCAVLAERGALWVARRRGKKIDRKAAGPGLWATVTNPEWDPESWDGNVWNTTECDSSPEDESEIKKEGAHAAPVFKRELVSSFRVGYKSAVWPRFMVPGWEG